MAAMTRHRPPHMNHGNPKKVVSVSQSPSPRGNWLFADRRPIITQVAPVGEVLAAKKRRHEAQDGNLSPQSPCDKMGGLFEEAPDGLLLSISTVVERKESHVQPIF